MILNGRVGACQLADHAGMDDLCRQLSEPGDKDPLFLIPGPEDARRPHERVDDVAGTQLKLLDSAGNTRPDAMLAKRDIRLLQRGLRACLLGGKQGFDARRDEIRRALKTAATGR
ncbi:hypothetical protein AZF01_09315 [Martelella sp. AD-3]|nr:hypothetical protein AZF01_09315 [Martelella sp. AD-3]